MKQHSWSLPPKWQHSLFPQPSWQHPHSQTPQRHSCSYFQIPLLLNSLNLRIVPNWEKQAWIWLLKNAGGRWPQRLLQKWGGANVYICTCLCMYVCMKARGQCQLSSSAFSYFLRQGLSDPGAVWPANPRKLHCLCFISVAITHVYHCAGVLAFFFFFLTFDARELNSCPDVCTAK